MVDAEGIHGALVSGLYQARSIPVGWFCDGTIVKAWMSKRNKGLCEIAVRGNGGFNPRFQTGATLCEVRKQQVWRRGVEELVVNTYKKGLRTPGLVVLSPWHLVLVARW